MALFTQTTPTVAARKTKMEGEVTYIKLDQIAPNPEQPRVEFDDAALEELAASIREHGVLQPIAVAEREDVPESYSIVMGERRWRAAALAGLVRIPAIIRTVDNQQEMLELSLIENVQRENLNPLDAAKAYKRLHDEFGLTQEQISQRTGKSRTSITKALQLLEAPRVVQEAVGNDQLPLTSALQMRDLTAHEARAIVSKTKTNGLSREAVGALVKETKAKRTKNWVEPIAEPADTDEAAPPIILADEPASENTGADKEVIVVETERTRNLRELYARFQAFDKDLDLFEQLTGVYSHTANVRRAVGPMLDTLKSNLGE